MALVTGRLTCVLFLGEDHILTGSADKTARCEALFQCSFATRAIMCSCGCLDCACWPGSGLLAVRDETDIPHSKPSKFSRTTQNLFRRWRQCKREVRSSSFQWSWTGSADVIRSARFEVCAPPKCSFLMCLVRLQAMQGLVT